MYIKYDIENNVIKCAKFKESFTAKDGYEIIETHEPLIETIVAGKHTEKPIATIKIFDKEDALAFVNMIKMSPKTVYRKEGTVQRDLTNIVTASTTQKQKWDSSSIPGHFALLRNDSTGLIYIGYRDSHRYSYYNVLCIDNATAYNFMNQVQNTAATKELKTKSGKVLYSVDQRDPVEYMYWSNFMNSQYEVGLKKHPVE